MSVKPSDDQSLFSLRGYSNSSKWSFRNYKKCIKLFPQEKLKSTAPIKFDNSLIIRNDKVGIKFPITVNINVLAKGTMIHKYKGDKSSSLTKPLIDLQKSNLKIPNRLYGNYFHKLSSLSQREQRWKMSGKLRKNRNDFKKLQFVIDCRNAKFNSRISSYKHIPAIDQRKYYYVISNEPHITRSTKKYERMIINNTQIHPGKVFKYNLYENRIKKPNTHNTSPASIIKTNDWNDISPW